MLVDVQVPVQGLTITEATLVRWVKQPGETVDVGEPLFEIETDKAVQEIESPASGVLLSHGAAEGDVVKLGAAIGVIGTEPGDSLPAATDTPRPPIPGEPHSATALIPPGLGAGGLKADEARPAVERLLVSPRARRAAERLGVDLATVRPSGARGGHIREHDVVESAASARAAQPARQPASPEIRPLTRARRFTAERTSASFRDAPHFYLSREVLAERMEALRADLASDPSACGGTRVSLTDLLVKALALGLRDCPKLNAQWRDGQVIPLPSIDIALAVGTPDGLYVPVIRSADALPVCRLAQYRADLVDRARRGDLRAGEMEGGSFTLTNLGRRGVDEFHAVINPPQSGILATGCVDTRPFVVGGQLGAYRTIVLTLSIDHRVVDGAEASELLERIAHRIERPGLLAVE